MNLGEIKGIGEKRLKKLAEAGINGPLDLLLHFPYRYADLSVPIDFSQLKDGVEIAFCGVAEGEPVSKFVRKGLSFVKAKFRVGDRLIGCTWFNRRFVARRLVPGKKFYVIGKVRKFKNSFDVSAPVLAAYREDGQAVVPLYRPVRGLPSNVLSEALEEVIRHVRVNSYISPELGLQHGLMPLNEAFRAVHRPCTMQEMRAAAGTIAVEKLANTLCLFSVMKRKNGKKRTFKYADNRTKLQEIIKSLPFVLTEDQQKTLTEILASLDGETPMNRLLQGDVGCGKTIVALLAMYYVALSGYQSVLMAPTELLARQHYRSALKIFETADVRVCLLTGGQSKSERDTALFNIRSGTADLIVGTHALLQDNVVFRNLSMVVTDEQHRFGVNQRGSLENKAQGTDCLVMSATPIPRTLALTLYGDLDQSVIRSLPKGKAATFTRMVPAHKTDDMITYVAEKAARNERTFLVCPRIGEEEDGLLSAEELYKRLRARFSPFGIALLHGQMKEADKNAVMNRFAIGEIRILVTTTVVEVGIDVPEATTMIVFHADRYGLSQLHQLRGRVGRGCTDSYCFLLTDSESEGALDRLKFFCGCTDGFELAEYDFKIRGAGDFIGTRQHGESSAMPMIPVNAELIRTAKEIAEIMCDDPAICKRITEETGESGCEYIKSLTLD